MTEENPSERDKINAIRDKINAIKQLATHRRKSGDWKWEQIQIILEDEEWPECQPNASNTSETNSNKPEKN